MVVENWAEHIIFRQIKYSYDFLFGDCFSSWIACFALGWGVEGDGRIYILVWGGVMEDLY
jgi:hypothetical protein